MSLRSEPSRSFPRKRPSAQHWAWPDSQHRTGPSFKMSLRRTGRDESPVTSMTRIALALLVGRDLEQARKRVRNGWLCGFLWAGWSFIGVVAGIWSLAPEAEERLSLSLFILAVVEVGVVAFLSYGVMRQRRPAAATLLVYFWVSRIFWIAAGAIGLGGYGEIIKFGILQVIPAYLFLQGMRGVWTWHRLTHPEYALVETEEPPPDGS